MIDDPLLGRGADEPSPRDQPPAAGDEAVEVTEQVRARQRSGARALALALGLFVVLIFAITIVKIRNGG